MIGIESASWRLFTDGGFQRQIDGTGMAGWGRRLPSVWECPKQFSGCYFDGNANHNCSYGARSRGSVCRYQFQA